MASRINATAVNVLDTAGGTLIVAADTHRRLLIIHNNSGAVMYVGPSGLTALTGMVLPDAQKLVLYWAEGDMSVCEPWYGIAAASQSSPANTRVLTSSGL
jgi:hypothetical protein